MTEADLDFYERMGRRMAVRGEHIDRTRGDISLKAYAVAAVLAVPAWVVVFGALRFAFGVL